MKPSFRKQIIEESLFTAHHSYYQSLGIETIKQQAGQVEQVSSDYQGRVIYELLQNAFDKADKKILVLVKDSCLYIANDGKHFTFQSNYNYKEAGTNKRSDFQSLCSISTSTKDANESIGNKGVGFKSVFAIAANGFVDIHTNGRILQEDAPEAITPVSFRVYDTFKHASELPRHLSEEVKTVLAKQITQLQKERKERGVPGYYYPVPLKEKSFLIEELLSQGYVTIMQIPFAESTAEEIQERFEEIKNIHFEFIKIRIPKNIIIEFDYEDIPKYCFISKVGTSSDTNPIMQCPLNESIKELAKVADITVTNPQIAIYFKGFDKGESTTGLLYNYLPTKIESPFKFVDFHADFHTTVDRKSINFDGKIGAYNRALLRACLELYFTCLGSYTLSNSMVKMNIEYISKQEFDLACVFDWKYFRLQNRWISFHLVRGILQIWNNREHDYSYQVASKFFSNLAKEYFEEPRSVEDHNQFFRRTSEFINYFSRDDNQARKWKDFFKIEFSNCIKELGARIIPTASGVGISVANEVLYREQKEEEISTFIPSFLSIDLVSYKVEDDDFKRFLGIKEFRDRNEVLKHYRQVSPIGKFNGADNQLTESQQQDLLRSISTLMGKKNDHILPTHRYNNFIIRTGQDNTVKNLADFSISTVFLKTKSGTYKPAQLCCFDELDHSFLPDLPQDIKQDTFLKYLGVSSSSKFQFVENAVWETLSEGLDYIPALWKESQDHQDNQLRHPRTLEGIRVVVNGKPIHPALINDNSYAFLEKLKVAEFKEESRQLLVKKYEHFPKEYLIQLLEVCKRNLHKKEQILRLYQNIFLPLHQHLQQYLVVMNSNLQFVTSTDFFIINNEHEYQLVESLATLEKPVLCYYKGFIDPKDFKLQGKHLQLQEQEIKYAAREDKTEGFHNDLLPKIFYVLLEISNSSLSDVDYFEDPDKITELSKKLTTYKYFEVERLQREIRIGELETKVVERAYNFNDRELYVCKGTPENIKIEAIAKCLFNNARIAKPLELILNYKDVNVLKVEYKKLQDVYEQVFNRYWIPDYDNKFKTFSIRILERFGGKQYSSDKSWFEYSVLHKSEFILDVFKAGEVDRLFETVHSEKVQFESGLFCDFELKIDFEIHTNQLAKLGVILDNVDQDDTVGDLRRRLNCLVGKIGIESELESLEQDIMRMFPEAFTTNVPQDILNATANKISVQSKVERIYQNITKPSDKSIKEFESSSNSASSSIPIKTKKVIYQGNALPSAQCDVIGASGEEEVLYFMIQHFLEIKEVENRKKALEEVHKLLSSLLKNSHSNVVKHTELFNSCLDVIDNDAELTKALIPFYYVTLHYKFAFIDLVVWYEGKAVMVEVKTTLNHKNNSFRISNSEINEARANQNYMIVRVTPQEIILMGNPIYNIKEDLMRIEGGNYVIQPHGYTFEFIRRDTKVDVRKN